MPETGPQERQANIAVSRTELVWPGKYDEQGRLRPVERVGLPFQIVETINQSRVTREQSPLLGLIPPPLFEHHEDTSWKNKLIWGDNKYVMASLLQGEPSIGLAPLKRWSDYIDFWAVDWNYQQDTCHNEWQTYRTRKSPVLRLVSDPHTYSEPGTYGILVKVIAIFGNDTTQLLEMKAA